VLPKNRRKAQGVGNRVWGIGEEGKKKNATGAGRKEEERKKKKEERKKIVFPSHLAPVAPITPSPNPFPKTIRPCQGKEKSFKARAV
jgi:hypothetical protein